MQLVFNKKKAIEPLFISLQRATAGYGGTLVGPRVDNSALQFFMLQLLEMLLLTLD